MKIDRDELYKYVFEKYLYKNDPNPEETTALIFADAWELAWEIQDYFYDEIGKWIDFDEAYNIAKQF
jgi:hypothetical protein